MDAKNPSLNNPQFAYFSLPYYKEQDVIVIGKDKDGLVFYASIVDGYNNPSRLRGSIPGKKAAEFVAEAFPKQFLSVDSEDIQIRAERTATVIDKQVIDLYPNWASAVGAFLFSYDDKDILVTVGSIFVYVWNGIQWEKPQEIGDYSLDPNTSPMNVSRFFGYKNLKEHSSLYLAMPDTLILSPKKPIFIATDGIKDFLSLEELNTFAKIDNTSDSHILINKLTEIMKSRRSLQKDDATIFLKI